MAEELNIDATTAVLNGGDDMQMMFIIPLQSYEALKKEIPNVDIIGHLSGKDTSVELITPDGAAIELKAQGWSE
jgi:thiamine-monophosphate kinase